MSWFQLRQKWCEKIKDADGNWRTVWTAVPASTPSIKWEEEKPRIRVKAEQIANKRKSEMPLTIPKKAEVFMFDEVCAEYCQHFNTDPYRMRIIEQEFGGRAIKEITKLDIRRFRKKILETRSHSTWNRIRNILVAIFNRGMEWDMCSGNPVIAIKKDPERRVKEFLTAEQAEALLREAKKEDYFLFAIIHVALKTGRRQGELLRLEWEDVDFKSGRIRFLIGKKKGGHEEFYQMPPQSVFQTLALLRRIHPEKPFPYFPRRKWRMVRDRVIETHGLPDKRFHALRHRCATEIIEKGGSLYDVQHYLQHASPATSQIYAHVSEKQEVKIRSLLEG